MRLKFICGLFFLALPSLTNAACSGSSPSYTAASASQPDVNACITLAVDGDTINIPASTQTWTTGVTITHAITISGAGIGSTIIRNNLASGELMTWTLVANKASRMTGIEFNMNGGATNFTGHIHIFGAAAGGGPFTDRSIRVDHCKFDHLTGVAIWPDEVYGVIDHNTALLGGSSFFVYTRIGIYATTYTDIDNVWAAVSNWGGSNFLFVETNTITHDAGSFFAVVDAYGAARLVYRYNTIANGWLEAHGTESGSRSRGTRAMEVYNNTFTTDTQGFSGIVNLRSGTLLVHDNTVTGYASNSTCGATCAAVLNNERVLNYFPPWQQGDGTNVWDKNNAGNPFASATATSGSFPTVTVSGATWTTNQWTGYMIHKTNSCTASSSIVCAAVVLSNTPTVITFSDGGGYNGNDHLLLTTGDTFELNQITNVMDQPGICCGANVGGATTPSPPGGWNNQTVDAIYACNNTHDGGSTMNNFSAGQYLLQIVNGTHFFNNTCAPGYTPYIYPHPLQGALPTLPAPCPKCLLGGMKFEEGIHAKQKTDSD